MDTKEILSEILLRLEEKDVNNLRKTTSDLLYLVGEIEKDEEYWRKKLSSYLGFDVSQRVGSSWKIMYENVLKFKKDFYGMIKLNYVEIVEGLIKEGFDLDADDNWAIRVASVDGHSEVVKLLLQDPRVDPSDDDNYAILLASDNGHSEVVKLLLQDERVKNSLSEIRLANYQKQIK